MILAGYKYTSCNLWFLKDLRAQFRAKEKRCWLQWSQQWCNCAAQAWVRWKITLSRCPVCIGTFTDVSGFHEVCCTVWSVSTRRVYSRASCTVHASTDFGWVVAGHQNSCDTTRLCTIPKKYILFVYWTANFKIWSCCCSDCLWFSSWALESLPRRPTFCNYPIPLIKNTP